MSFEVGGEKAWKVRRLGDIGIAYHWVNNEPGMVLFPYKRRSKINVFIICLSAAYKYVNSDGHPNLQYMMLQAMQAAEHMGFGARDKSAVKTIVDAITDGLPDLVSMPPEPDDHTDKSAKRNIGEMSLAVDGEIIAEHDVPDVSENEVAGLMH